MDLLSSLLEKVKQKAQELGKNIRPAIQTGISNARGNIEAIANPQTRSTWFAGFNIKPEKIVTDVLSLSPGGTILQHPSVKPVAEAYIKNRYVEPVLNIPSSAKKLISPKSTLLERGQGALGVLGGAATLIPDPVHDVAMPVADLLIGTRAYQLKNKDKEVKPLEALVKGGIPAMTLEKHVGLGEALTTNPTGQAIGNIAQLPAALLLAHSVKPKKMEGVLKDVSKAVKEGKITLEEGQALLRAVKEKSKINMKGAATGGGIKAEMPSAFTGKKVRGVIKTAKESEFVDPVIKSMIRGEYVPKSNKETYQWAANLVNTNLEEAEKFVKKIPPSAETTAVASHLVKKYQDIGDFKKAEDLIEEIAQKATKAGQFNQAFSQWKLLTPEGMQRYAQRVIHEANEKMDVVSKAVRKILGKETRVELTNEDYKEINNWMKLAMKEPNEEVSARYVKKAFEVINKKLPWGISDVLDEFRYNNMLSNPLTHLRNFTSNAWQAYVIRPLDILFTKGPVKAAKYEVSAISSIPDAIENFAKTLKEGKRFKKMDVDELVSFGLEKPRVLGKYNVPSQLMEASDSLFSTIIESGEKAIGRTPEEAYKTAQKYLFREGLHPEGQGWVLNKIDDITRVFYGLRRVGLGWVIPFVRTPMNVAKQWIEYSPLGFSTIIGAADKKEQLVKALIGSTISLYGVKLALEDRITAQAPTDPLAKKLFYDSGKKPFSIRIGDVWVPTQSFGVYGFALSLPAIFKHYFEENPQSVNDDTIEKALKAVGGLAEYWANQTFVKNFGDFIRLISGDKDYTWTRNLVQPANQVKPWAGMMRYIATVVDPIFRKPKTLKETLISDIPFLTKQLPYYETTTGEPAKRNITNYIAPYAVGFANREYEDLYKTRMKQLKSNAQEKKIKEEAEKGIVKQQGEKIPLVINGEVKILDLSKIQPKEGETEYQKAVRRKKAFSYVDDILDSDLPVEKQGEILAKLGIDPEDASYYNIARQSSDIRYIWVKDEIGKYGDNRQEILNTLLSLRREVNGKKILSNEILDDLVEEGILSEEEGKYLKRVKYTKKGEVKVKLTGRGRSAKIKAPKIPTSTARFTFKTKPPKAAQIQSIRKRGSIARRGRIVNVARVRRYK